ncbi:unnamed protein product [Effrenium voratum]|nr:unnamed protein product [Effrenium voratum]
MAAADVLTPDEVKQTLSLQRIFALADDQDSGKEPLLVRVLDALARARPPQGTVAIQTEKEGLGQSLDEKLRACVVPSDRDRRSAEERMLQFQARCEATVRREAEAELARIRMLEREQIALEEAAKGRAELQEAMARVKLELAEREERLRQRERLAAERNRAKEVELEKKAVEWRTAAQRVIDEEQQRQSTRAKHLDVEEKRLQILQQGLDRREQDLKNAEERSATLAGELSRKAEEAHQAAKLAAQTAVATEKEELQRLRLSLEREKLQVEAARGQDEACKDRLASEAAAAERAATQARADAREVDERLACRNRELEDARQQIHVLKVAAEQVVALQHELESVRSEKSALQNAMDTHKQSRNLLESSLEQLQREKAQLSTEVEKLRSQQAKLEEGGLQKAQELQAALAQEVSNAKLLKEQLAAGKGLQREAQDGAASRQWWANAVRNLEHEILSGFTSDDSSVHERKGRSSRSPKRAWLQSLGSGLGHLQHEKLRLSHEVDRLRGRLNRFEVGPQLQQAADAQMTTSVREWYSGYSGHVADSDLSDSRMSFASENAWETDKVVFDSPQRVRQKSPKDSEATPKPARNAALPSKTGGFENDAREEEGAAEREESLRQRERSAERNAQEVALKKKAAERRTSAQRVIDEEQQRQSTRAKHLDVEERSPPPAAELPRKAEEERSPPPAAELPRKAEEERSPPPAAELPRKAEEERSPPPAAELPRKAEEERSTPPAAELPRKAEEVAEERNATPAAELPRKAEEAHQERSTPPAAELPRKAEEAHQARSATMAAELPRKAEEAHQARSATMAAELPRKAEEAHQARSATMAAELPRKAEEAHQARSATMAAVLPRKAEEAHQAEARSATMAAELPQKAEEAHQDSEAELVEESSVQHVGTLADSVRSSSHSDEATPKPGCNAALPSKTGGFENDAREEEGDIPELLGDVTPASPGRASAKLPSEHGSSGRSGRSERSARSARSARSGQSVRSAQSAEVKEDDVRQAKVSARSSEASSGFGSPSPTATPHEGLADRFKAEIEARMQAKRAGSGQNLAPVHLEEEEEQAEEDEEEEEGMLEVPEESSVQPGGTLAELGVPSSYHTDEEATPKPARNAGDATAEALPSKTDGFENDAKEEGVAGSAGDLSDVLELLVDATPASPGRASAKLPSEHGSSGRSQRSARSARSAEVKEDDVREVIVSARSSEASSGFGSPSPTATPHEGLTDRFQAQIEARMQEPSAQHGGSLTELSVRSSSHSDEDDEGVLELLEATPKPGRNIGDAIAEALPSETDGFKNDAREEEGVAGSAGHSSEATPASPGRASPKLPSEHGSSGRSERSARSARSARSVRSAQSAEAIVSARSSEAPGAMQATTPLPASASPGFASPSPTPTPRECLADRFQAEIEARMQAKRAGSGQNLAPVHMEEEEEQAEEDEEEEEGMLEVPEDSDAHESFQGSEDSGW